MCSERESSSSKRGVGGCETRDEGRGGGWHTCRQADRLKVPGSISGIAWGVWESLETLGPEPSPRGWIVDMCVYHGKKKGDHTYPHIHIHTSRGWEAWLRREAVQFVNG